MPLPRPRRCGPPRAHCAQNSMLSGGRSQNQSDRLSDWCRYGQTAPALTNAHTHTQRAFTARTLACTHTSSCFSAHGAYVWFDKGTHCVCVCVFTYARANTHTTHTSHPTHVGSVWARALKRVRSLKHTHSHTHTRVSVCAYVGFVRVCVCEPVCALRARARGRPSNMNIIYQSVIKREQVRIVATHLVVRPSSSSRGRVSLDKHVRGGRTGARVWYSDTHTQTLSGEETVRVTNQNNTRSHRWHSTANTSGRVCGNLLSSRVVACVHRAEDSYAHTRRAHAHTHTRSYIVRIAAHTHTHVHTTRAAGKKAPAPPPHNKYSTRRKIVYTLK